MTGHGPPGLGHGEGPGSHRSLAPNLVQNLDSAQGTRPVRQPLAAAVGSLAAVIPPPIGCLEAERGVLGGLLCLPALEAQVAAGFLTPADFTDPRHAAILEACVELTAAGTPADPITVVGHLRRTGTERCFTSDRDPGVFLFDLLDALPSLGNLEHYRKIVLEDSARRRARDAAVRVAQAAEQEDLDTARQVTVDEMLAVLEAFDRIGPTS